MVLNGFFANALAPVGGRGVLLWRRYSTLETARAGAIQWYTDGMLLDDKGQAVPRYDVIEIGKAVKDGNGLRLVEVLDRVTLFSWSNGRTSSGSLAEVFDEQEETTDPIHDFGQFPPDWLYKLEVEVLNGIAANWFLLRSTETDAYDRLAVDANGRSRAWRYLVVPVYAELPLEPEGYDGTNPDGSVTAWRDTKTFAKALDALYPPLANEGQEYAWTVAANPSGVLFDLEPSRMYYMFLRDTDLECSLVVLEFQATDDKPRNVITNLRFGNPVTMVPARERSLRRLMPSAIQAQQPFVDAALAAHPNIYGPLSDVARILRIPSIERYFYTGGFSVFTGYFQNSDAYNSFALFGGGLVGLQWEAPTSWAAHSTTQVLWDSSLPPYENPLELEYGYYVGNIRLQLILQGNVEGGGQRPYQGVAPKFPNPRPDERDDFYLDEELFTGMGKPLLVDDVTRKGNYFNVQGFIPVYNGSKVLKLASNALGWAGRAYDEQAKSSMPVSNKGAGKCRWAIGLGCELYVDIIHVRVKGVLAQHKTIETYRRGISLYSRSSEPDNTGTLVPFLNGTEVFYDNETFPWDARFFNALGDEEEEREGADPLNPVHSLEEILWNLVILALVALLAVVLIEGIVASGVILTAMAVVENALIPLVSSSIRVMAIRATGLAAANAASKAGLTQAIASNSAAEYEAVRRVAAAALQYETELTTELVRRVFGG